MRRKPPKTTVKTKLTAQAMVVLAELIKRPWLTQPELAEIVNLKTRQIGVITRAEDFRLAMWEALDVPEDYLRKVAPQALQFLGRTIREGMNRKLADGTMEAPSGEEKDRALKAASTLAKLGIGVKVEVSTKGGGEDPGNIVFSRAETAAVVAALKEVQVPKHKD